MANNLGLYLKAVRVGRGSSVIAEYLKERGVEISETYYRDLEGGRKTIRLETAKELARQLDLEKRSFFTHLLKDILDEDVFEEVIKANIVEEVRSLSDDLAKAKNDATLVQAAFSKQIGARRTEVSEEAVKALNENFELLPVVHAVYMRDEISFDDVSRVLAKNRVTRDVKDVAIFFSDNRFARVDWERKTFSRFSTTFRIPRTELGQKFKSRFLLAEYQKSAEKNKDSSGDPAADTWSYSTIFISSAEKMRLLVQEDAARLVARLNADELQLGDEGAKPFFASVIISPRDDYEP
jgi:transcriptional regulator with XRE-family HTH domain